VGGGPGVETRFYSDVIHVGCLCRLYVGREGAREGEGERERERERVHEHPPLSSGCLLGVNLRPQSDTQE